LIGTLVFLADKVQEKGFVKGFGKFLSGGECKDKKAAVENLLSRTQYF
jgi:hypothetical protein